ncbi:hypothetical protein MKW98_022973 [Papaver atlanticum]|uniref:Uncharacterized protein n=1 Tax=Papaver atlanticum TaxID=357466 RepID=A0AAD4XU69_9MAGN|nr:hypothetical protein MKW98_022973 [Papaver atlanticum]
MGKQASPSQFRSRNFRIDRQGTRSPQQWATMETKGLLILKRVKFHATSLALTSPHMSIKLGTNNTSIC